MNKLLPVLNAAALFKQCKVDPNFGELRTLAGLDNQIFDVAMKAPLEKYAEAVQLAPASENHHHSGPGGLLVHTLEVIGLALKIRKGYQLPLGGSIAQIGEQKHLWTYAVFTACLLHDIGKLSSTIRLRLQLRDGQHKNWTPQGEPLVGSKNIAGYTIQFHKAPYQYHSKLSLIHFELIPSSIRDWLMQSQTVMTELLAYLWGDRYESGIIGEIVERADRESTARNLQIPVEKTFSNTIAPIDRYLRFIRQWLSEGVIRVNASGGMGWVDKEGHLYLVCRSLAQKLIVECNEQGLTNLPQDPIRVYDILQEHGYALSTDDRKAIWTIKIKCEEFEHSLTCLKFRARQFELPQKPLAPFTGEITLASAEAAAKEERVQKEKEENSQEQTQVKGNIEHTDNADKADNAEKTIENPEQKNQSLKDKLTLAAKAVESSKQDTKEKNKSVSETQERSPEDTEEKTTNSPKNYPKKAVEKSDEIQDTSDAASEPVEAAFDFSAKDVPQRFLSWLKRGLIEKTILVNDVNAEVHILEDGIFLLAPAIFKTWINRQGLDGDKLHKNLSRRFARLRVNIRNEKSQMNVHSYWVHSGNRGSRINGWLLPFDVVYENDYPIPKPNKYIKKELGEPGQ